MNSIKLKPCLSHLDVYRSISALTLLFSSTATKVVLSSSTSISWPSATNATMGRFMPSIYLTKLTISPRLSKIGKQVMVMAAKKAHMNTTTIQPLKKPGENTSQVSVSRNSHYI